MAAGISPEEARRRAILEFGGLERVKEEVREARWETHLDNLLRDFWYAVRNLRKDRPFTFLSVFALVLGIGAATVVFSVVYSAIFDALPYKDFNRSVVIQMRNLSNEGEWKDRKYFSLEEVRAFREQNQVFEDIVAYYGNRPSYDDGKSTRNFAMGAAVTPALRRRHSNPSTVWKTRLSQVVGQMPAQG